MSEILRDQYGRRIGEIRQQGSDQQVAFDARGVRVGMYNSRSGVTLDKYGRRVGTGNLLAGLVFKCQ